MNILMVSAEMAPVAKVGGLADVVAGLSRVLGTRGHDVRVVLPLYGHLDRRRLGINLIKGLPPLSICVGQRVYPMRIYRAGSARAAVKIYLIENDDLFGREGVYTDDEGRGFTDSLARAALHCQAALLLPRLLAWPVEVIHAHDAAAAAALVYRRQWYAGSDLIGPAATLLTIHNLAHQEIHPAGATEVLGLPAAVAAYPGLLEFQGQLNLLKGGILAADAVNTVSPGYAQETRSTAEFGCGLQKILADRGADYTGILNGAAYQTWDPARDSAIPARYSAHNLAGKTTCQVELRRELGLDAATDPGEAMPLCGFVGRLVRQKGLDLLLPLLDRLVGDGFTFAVLGTGERDLEEAVSAAAARHPGRVGFYRGYDEDLAHRIYAGSDAFLMPSAFEPCGLSQMYALKYGTPPVVRQTGGLADTVTETTGFVFTGGRPEDLLRALRRTQAQWMDKKQWRELQRRGMACDFSWDTAAVAYEEIYARVAQNKQR